MVEQLPPGLSGFLRAIAVGQQRFVNNFVVTLLSMEMYEQGIRVHFEIAPYQRPDFPVFVLSVRDDLGNGYEELYTSQPHDEWGYSGAGVCYYTVALVPPLHSASTTLLIEVQRIVLRRYTPLQPSGGGVAVAKPVLRGASGAGASVEMEEISGPWQFTVSLAPEGKTR